MHQPHTADARTLERPEFHVLEPETLLKSGPDVLAVLSRNTRKTAGQRQPSANRGKAGAPGWRASSGDRGDGRKVGELLTSGADAGLVYSGLRPVCEIRKRNG